MARVTFLLTLFTVICTATAYTYLTCYSCDSNQHECCSDKYWEPHGIGVDIASNTEGFYAPNFINPFCTKMTIPSSSGGSKTVQDRKLMGYKSINGVKTLMVFNGTTSEPANLERNSGDLDGYFCQYNLCNSAIGSLTGGSLLTAFCLALLTKLF